MEYNKVSLIAISGGIREKFNYDKVGYIQVSTPFRALSKTKYIEIFDDLKSSF